MTTDDTTEPHPETGMATLRKHPPTDTEQQQTTTEGGADPRPAPWSDGAEGHGPDVTDDAVIRAKQRGRTIADVQLAGGHL